MNIAVCWKWAAQRGLVDELTGEITPDPRSFGPSPADQAALEIALTLSSQVTVVCAGPAEAQTMLGDALAAGAAHAIHCQAGSGDSSVDVAAALAHAIGSAQLVLCGDYSTDRGSGSVPAFLAAEMGAAQALGCISVRPSADDGLEVERRLDRGRREELLVPFPAVVSVEGSVARLRRAPLARVLEAQEIAIQAGPAVVGDGGPIFGEPRPFRPRTRNPEVAFAGVGDPLARVLEITQATVDRTPPRLLTLPPDQAADAIMEQLREWGYVADREN